MYKIAVEVAPSPIDGKGVFTLNSIAKKTVAWLFTEGHDVALSVTEYHELSQPEKDRLDKTGYLSPWTNLWVFPPNDDPAQFTNHSDKNNLSAVYDESVSTEPYFIANRDIQAGEELTNNYHEFDKITRETKPDWAK